MDLSNIIQGQKFWEIADTIYSPNINNVDYNRLTNTFELSELQSGDVIYTHTMYAELLNNELYKANKPVIVVSHNADDPMDFTPAPCVVKWYSQNVDIDNDRVESIPIGIENNRWFTEVNKMRLMDEVNRMPLERVRGTYANHSIKTNPKERNASYNAVKRLKQGVIKSHGHPQKNLKEYLIDLSICGFIVSPEGNGIDCHRTWEALYMGCIPVVKNNINIQFYKQLPILIIDNWDVLTDEMLDKAYDDMQHTEYNYNLLNFNYWKKKIWDMANGLK